MHSRPAVLPAFTIVSALCGGVGCAGSSNYSEVATQARPRTVIEVSSRNWPDVNVYAVRAATKFRLGTVRSFSTERFRVPEAIVATHEIRFRVEVIGSRAAFTTEPVLITSGQRVNWMINDHLPLSSLAIHR